MPKALPTGRAHFGRIYARRLVGEPSRGAAVHRRSVTVRGRELCQSGGPEHLNPTGRRHVNEPALPEQGERPAYRFDAETEVVGDILALHREFGDRRTQLG